VRFETLRRAALYLSTRSVTPDVALPVRLKLGRRLQARAADTRLLPRARALARFDAGCFEALCGKDRTLSSGRDGYAQAKRALDALPEAAAEVEYVLARIAPPGQAGDAHAGAALRGAKDDTLLSRAILRDWQHEYPSLEALRAELARQDALTEPEPGFPTPPPVPGADPERRHEVVLLASRALAVRDEPDGAVAVGWVAAHPVALRLEVGHRMVLGTRIRQSVHVGEQHLERHDSEALLGGEPLHAVGSKSFLHQLPEGSDEAPVVLRATVEVFETDVPGQHLWHPEGGRYRVLWTRRYEVRLR
jgi:hypothetical protein